MELPIKGKNFFASWSGGKDSCLALHYAVKNGGEPQALLTMMAEGGEFSRSHGLPKRLIEAQAEALGLKAVFRSASWEKYETQFLSALRRFRKYGTKAGVFGDIDGDEHKDWDERVCKTAGIIPVLPLWKKERRALLEEFMDLGYKAVIIAVNEKKLGWQFLGKSINLKTIKDLEDAGVDPSGEAGEYHTVVTSGPLFSSKLDVSATGPEQHGDYLYLRIENVKLIR